MASPRLSRQALPWCRGLWRQVMGWRPADIRARRLDTLARARPSTRESQMSSATLADQLLQILSEAGVQRIYGLVGDSLNPVVDAVRRAEGIEWVHVRNEEAGAFAAGAQASLTRGLA